MDNIGLRMTWKNGEKIDTNGESSKVLKVRAFLLAQMVMNMPTMWETQVQSLVQEDPLEKGVATNSSILTWRIPWMERPGGLQSMGSPIVRHDWVTSTHTTLHQATTYWDITEALWSRQALGSPLRGGKNLTRQGKSRTLQGQEGINSCGIQATMNGHHQTGAEVMMGSYALHLRKGCDNPTGRGWHPWTVSFSPTTVDSNSE